VLQYILQLQSLTGTLSQQSRDQILGLCTQVRGILDINSRDSLVSLVVGVGLEWRFPHEELVGENSETPEINLVIMEGSFYHLRREVVQSPAHCASSTVGSVYRPTKISNLDVAFGVEEQVFRFDISMNHLLTVTVGESVGHLTDVTSRQGLLEPPLGLLLQALVELALGGELQDEVDPALVVEISEEAEDVRVSQVGLDFNFSPQLVLHLSLLELGLEEDLQGHNVLTGLLPGEVDVTKFTLSQRTTDVEVLQFPAVLFVPSWRFAEGGSCRGTGLLLSAA